MRVGGWLSPFMMLLSLGSSSIEAASDLETLLQKARREAAAALRVDEEREARFLAEKQQRAELLARAQRELEALEAGNGTLRETLERNQATLVDLEADLAAAGGDWEALLQAARQGAGELDATLRDSLVSAQRPGRSAQLSALLHESESASADAPGIEDLHRLWLLWLEELVESGRRVRFDAQVVEPDGRSHAAPVVRIGTFSALQGGRLLRYEEGRLYVLAPQPEGAPGELVSTYAQAQSGLVPAPVDPSRGGWLPLLTHRPSLLERIRQGGIVGYIILGLGALGLLLGIWRLLALWIVSGRVRRQLRRIDEPRDDNPLGRVLLVFRRLREEGKGVEPLELHLQEAALREVPRLTRAQSFLKLLTAVAPLLGLLGTVIGMILTFQAITVAGSGDTRLMADGIGQALVTTVLGLVTAIPLLFLHNLLASRSRALIRILDQEAAGLIGTHLAGSARSEPGAEASS